MKSNKFWFAVLGAILIVSAAATLMLRQAPATLALVYSDGKLVERLDLSLVSEPHNITVVSGSGVNVISVENGRIRISDANCPDSSCIRQGWISGGVTPIVCLPHRLVIKLEGGGTQDVDAVVG